MTDDDNHAAGTIDISIVIPCLNAADTLAGQLDALFPQVLETRRRCEVVVVDNRSSDGTAELAQRRLADIGLGRVLVEPTRGRHHARNAGVAACTGRSVLFVDADDVVQPGYVDAMVAALDEHEFCASAYAEDPTEPTPYGRVQVDGLMAGYGFLPYAAAGTLGIRRALFDAIGGFRFDVADDVDLCWRAQLAGAELAFVPAARIRYRQRPSMRGMFRQHFAFGMAEAHLYSEYRDAGMPRRSPGDLRTDLRMLAGGALLASGDARIRWLRRLGRQSGRVVGSLRHRVVYF